ncbi:hypothetical protein [Photorhabdus luminescens]|nr:hypothetical protein [Photorhabdus luminescens]MCW7761544.1 hypothetical protein [Photorhabdus luminescens subsp. venezuelensis]
MNQPALPESNLLLDNIRALLTQGRKQAAQASILLWCKLIGKLAA